MPALFGPHEGMRALPAYQSTPIHNPGVIEIGGFYRLQARVKLHGDALPVSAVADI